MDAVTLSAVRAQSDKRYGKFPERNVNGRGRMGTVLSNGTDTSQTSRLRFPLRGNCVTVRLVYANFWQQSGGNEPGGGNDVTVKASIENPALTAGDPTAASTPIPVFFNGQRTAVMNNNGVLISDPIVVNLLDGSPLWVRSMATVTSGGKWVNSYNSAFTAGVNVDGGGVNEGVVANTDSVDSGTIGGSSSSAFGPVAILAAADSRKPSVVVAGDSIAIDTGTVTVGALGYISRACVNAGFPIVRIGEGGERALTVASIISYHKRTRLAALCGTHVISNYGTNDIFGSARTLAQIKADLQTLWSLWSRLGLVVYQCTVLPRPNSTDGNQTLANQTTVAAETVRTGLNSWLRDTSASGAVAQSAGTLRGVFDPCAAIEVNAAGALTLNGGFWAVPSSGTVITGTATAATASVITDSGQARTVNGDVGLAVSITSATTGAGQAQQVVTNTATAWTFLSALTTAPTGTVVYKLAPSYCADLIHPTEPAHVLMGNALPVSSTLKV